MMCRFTIIFTVIFFTLSFIVCEKVTTFLRYKYKDRAIGERGWKYFKFYVEHAWVHSIFMATKYQSLFTAECIYA